MATKQSYGVQDIKTLEGIEAIRMRPGMYIGDVGPDGVRQITLEIISNAIDEYLNGYCTHCTIWVHKDNSICIEDNGRGVPFGKAADGSETLENIFTKLHTGGKFDNAGQAGYNTSGGMNGVGAKATNALSEWFMVMSTRNGQTALMTFKKGKRTNYEVHKQGDESIGTAISFLPDKTIFKQSIELDYNILRNQLQELAYLSPGLTFEFHYKDKPTEIIASKLGIIDYINDLNKKKKVLTSTFYAEALDGKVGVKLAVNYNDSYSDTYKLYTNSIPNTGGAHLTGFRTALTQTINEYARENKLLKEKEDNITGEELKEGLTLVLSFIMPDPIFSGQTKDILTSSEARTIVQRLVSKELETWLNANPKDARIIIGKALEARKAREAAKKAKEAVRQPKEKGLKAKLQLSNKFIDCTSKKPEERNLLLVEGLSAGSAAVEARNTKTDCIYMLRGKTISPLKTEVSKILANQEMSDIIKVIGAGFDKTFDVSKMNFNKIVITSDQDSDGFSIELLLITFFYTYMRPLIEQGKLYRAVTPLYILRKGKEEKYFYTEEEMANWKKTGASGWDTLRAKGLGELNATDLKKVCFENERFKRITISDAKKTNDLLNTLMGPSADLRKRYIYENATRLGFNFD